MRYIHLSHFGEKVDYPRQKKTFFFFISFFYFYVPSLDRNSTTPTAARQLRPQLDNSSQCGGPLRS